jgi:hypothetical protein
MNQRPNPEALLGIEPDSLAIAVRAFAPPAEKPDDKKAVRKRSFKPTPPPSGRLSLTPKRRLTQRNDCESAHTNFVRPMNWTRAGSFTTRPL